MRDRVESTRSIFAQRVDEVLHHDKMKLTRLSQLTGMSVAGLSNIIRGKYAPSLYSAMSIARALDVSLDWLCGLNEEG